MVRFPKIESLQRPNLLINSDFKSGIINQKGLSEYNPTSKEYTIDMWYTYAGIVSVLDGYIKVTKNRNMSGNATFTQLFSSLNEKCTIAIKTRAINGIAKIHIGSLGTFDLSANKINIFTIAGNFNVIYFELSDYIELEYVKLEKGSNFTGMPVWDETLELLKCQRHYIVIKNLKIALRGHINQIFTNTFTLPIKMKKVPTVTIEDTTNSYNVSNITAWADSNVMQISFKTLSDNMIDCRVNKVVLDAYEY